MCIFRFFFLVFFVYDINFLNEINKCAVVAHVLYPLSHYPLYCRYAETRGSYNCIRS